jgi:hypothetical protein
MREFIARLKIATCQAMLDRERDPAEPRRLNAMAAKAQANLRTHQAAKTPDEG